MTIQSAAVLDLSANGLSIVRNLADRGIPVFAFDVPRKVRLAKTRLARCVPCPDPAKSPEEVVSLLMAWARQIGDRPVLYPASDDFVQMISTYRDQLRPFYRFLLPEREMVEAVIDKRQTHLLAMKHDIPCPRTWILEENARTIDSVLEELCFPCIIKPTQSYQFRRIINKKAFLTGNRDELRQRYEAIRDVGPVIIQEFIPGGDDQIYQVGFLLDGHSNVLAQFMGRKLIQFPYCFGSGALVVSEVDSDVVELGTRVVKDFGLRGLCNVEFKKDPRNGQLKLMEVDPRLWLWHDLSRHAGVDLSYLYYRFMTGDSIPPDLVQATGMKWIYEIRTLISGWEQYRKGDRSLVELVHFLGGRKHPALFRLDDPLPFLRMTWAHLFPSGNREKGET